MRKLLYRVGTNGYTTVCTTLASAQTQASQNKVYTITPFFENIIENSKPTAKRAEMLSKYGFVKKGLTI